MKKDLIVILFVLFFVPGCFGPGADLSKRKNLQWSFVKSPSSGICYEMMTENHAAGIFSFSSYSGMSPVEDKYCQ